MCFLANRVHSPLTPPLQGGLRAEAGASHLCRGERGRHRAAPCASPCPSGFLQVSLEASPKIVLEARDVRHHSAARGTFLALASKSFRAE